MTQPWRRQGEALLLAVRVTPRAAKDELGGMWADADGAFWLSARVTAAPDKGGANKALIQLIARTLRVAGATISLESGAAARLKRLRIAPADDSVEAALSKLTERT